MNMIVFEEMRLVVQSHRHLLSDPLRLAAVLSGAGFRVVDISAFLDLIIIMEGLDGNNSRR